MTNSKNMILKLFVVLSFVLFLIIESESLGCGGCSKSKSSNMAANVQSAVGSNTNASNYGGFAGSGRIIGGPSAPAFKSSEIFNEVGQPGDQDPDKVWDSAIKQ